MGLLVGLTMWVVYTIIVLKELTVREGVLWNFILSVYIETMIYVALTSGFQLEVLRVFLRLTA